MFRWFSVSALVISLFVVSCNSGNVPLDTELAAQSDGEALTQLLTAEFERQLAAQGGKGISDVTGVFVDPLVRVDAAGDAQLGWTYNNNGDYDQNSEVNIADITPIVLHFSKTDGSPGWETGVVADGDGNGEVNLADISPIAVNFLSSVTNYVVEADIQGNSTWVPVANVAFGSGQAPPAGGLLQFSVTIPGGETAAAFRVSAGSEIPAGDLISIEDVSIPPILTSGNWTTYNIEEGSNYGQHNSMVLIDGMPAIVYNREDRHDIKYARAENAKPLSPADWVTMTVDSSESRGGTLDIAECQGVPCVVYEDFVAQDLYFANATSVTPGAEIDWAVHEFDIAGGMAEPQIATLENNPVMAYRTGGSVRFARSNVVGGLPVDDAGWTKVDVETVDFQEYPRLAIVGGLPGVAFKHKRSGGYSVLTYSRATSTTPDLPENWVTMALDGTEDNVGNDIVLIEAAGVPTIGYSNFPQTGPRYLRYTQASITSPVNTSDWEISNIRIADQDHYGKELAMTWYQDRPLFIYQVEFVASPSELHGTFQDAVGQPNTAELDHAVLDAAPAYILTGEMSAIILADGTPAFVYRTSDGLKYSYYTP